MNADDDFDAWFERFWLALIGPATSPMLTALKHRMWQAMREREAEVRRAACRER